MRRQKPKPKESLINFELNPRRYLELALYITILGAALRFYHLDYNSLWLDEAATFVNVNTDSFMTMWQNVINDHHAPLFFIVVWLVHFISSSEFWLRVPSVLAGIATIPLLYFFGKEVVNEKVGLFAALLLALSPYHIFYSQEARMYTFTTLFITLAFYAFFKAKNTDDGRYWILMWLACAAAFWTHFYTGFVVVPLVVGYVLLKKNNWDLQNFVGGAALAFIIVSPVLYSFLNQSNYFLGKTFAWGVPAILIPFATLIEFSFQNQIIASVFILLAGLGIWLLSVKDRTKAILLSLFLLVPILISMLMSTHIPFNVRYQIYLLPLFLVIVSVSIDRLTRFWKNRNITFAAISLIFVCAVVSLPPYYENYSKEDWRGFSQALTKDTKIGDVIVVVPGYIQIPLTYYYHNSTDATVLLGANSAGDLQNITPDRKIYYVVTGDINALDPTGNSWRWLQGNTKPLGQHNGINLFVKERAA